MDAGHIRNIVVGVAELDATEPALAHAAALARRTGATLHAVHAYSPGALVVPPAAIGALAFAPTLPLPPDEVETELRHRLEALLAGAGARGVPHLQLGAAHAAVAQVGRETGAELLVVGATRMGAVGRLLLGTTAARVLRQAGQPVLVVRGGAPGEGGRVLLTSDLSELSERACAAGVEFGRAVWGEGARFRCVCAAGPLGAAPTPGPQAVLGAARERLEEVLARLPGAAGAVEAAVRPGDPHPEILAEAREWGAELVVLGTHGRSGVSRLFLGSVAEAVVRDVECHALVVPAAAEA